MAELFALAAAAGSAYSGSYIAAAAYAYAAYSIYDAKRQARNAKSAAQASIADRLVSARVAADPVKLVYGRTRIAGTVLYACQHGSLREYVTLVLALAPHPITSVDEIWFNDKWIGSLDGSGNVTSGSAFWKADTRTVSELRPHDGPGATVTLSHAPTQIMSVSIGDAGSGEYGGILRPGVDYTLDGDDITWISALGSGYAITFTYQWDAGVSLARCKVFLGSAAGERDTDLETNSGGEWTSAHTGKKIARLHVTLKYDQDVFGVIGLPNVTAVVKGKSVYNFSTGTYAWSRNAALCAADYLMDPLGHGIDIARIDTTAAIAAQSACDEKIPSWPMSAVASTDVVTINGPMLSVGDAVSFYSTGSLPGGISAGTTYYIRTVEVSSPQGGGYTLSATLGGSKLNITSDGSGKLYQARYTVDGQLSTESAPKDNADLLAGAMCGRIVYSAGTYRLKAGIFASPVATVDESDLAPGAIQIQPAARRAELYNGVRGTFPDPQNLYQTTSFAPYLSSTYQTQDNGVSVVADIALPLTQDAMRAQRVAKRMLFEHRQSLRLTATWKISTLALQPRDTVYVKLARYGWDTMNGGLGKLFIVTDKKTSPPSGVTEMSLVETSSTIDDWTYTEATNPDPAPNTFLPDPNHVEPIAGLAATSGADTFTLLSDGTIIPYLELSWTQITAAAVTQGGRIEILWKRAPEIAWQTIKCDPDSTSQRLFPVSAGETINVQVYVYNGAGSRSQPVIATFVGDSALPSGVNVSAASGNLLSDANFSDVTQWALTLQSGLTDAVVWQTEQTWKVPGTPTNAILYQNGAQNLYCFAQSASFPVVAGQRYAAFVDCMPVRCSAVMYVTWFDAAGAFISQMVGNTLTTNGGDPRVEAAYGTSGVIGEAPTGVVGGRMVLLKYGTDVGQPTSGAYWLKPFIGPVAAGQATYPTWNSGVAPTITTAQLADQAATRIYATEFVPASPVDGAYALSKRVAVLSFTAEFTGPCEITGQIECWQRDTTDPGGTLLWELTSTGATLTGVKDSGSKITADVGTTLGATAGYLLFSTGTLSVPQNAVRTFTRTASLIAGQTYNLGITVTANGSATIPGSNYNYIAYACLRVVQIKK